MDQKRREGGGGGACKDVHIFIYQSRLTRIQGEFSDFKFSMNTSEFAK
jgi:hypothetical protein